MEMDSSHNEASSTQRSDNGQSQLLDTNAAAIMQRMMQQMMEQMSELMARVEKVETKDTTTTAANTAPTISTSTPATSTNYTCEPKGLKDPDAFDGTRSQYLPWKYQIEAKLRSEPRRFHTSQLAIDYTFSRTTGDARARIFPWVSMHAASGTLNQFFQHLDSAFKDAHMAETARNKLQNMRQKTDNVRDFIQDFNKEALTANLYDHAILKSMFLNALHYELQTALAGTIFSEHTTIEEMQSHAAAVSDNLWRLKLRRKNKVNPPLREPSSTASPPDTMDWEPSRTQTQRAAWVPQKELNRRRDEGLCLRCGKEGHFINACKLKPAQNLARQLTRVTKATSKPKEKDTTKVDHDDATAVDSDSESGKE
jgi:Asp-tRNA(Asn)/Glu-tRNA(Gln) amidotransferase C subunit